MFTCCSTWTPHSATCFRLINEHKQYRTSCGDGQGNLKIVFSFLFAYSCLCLLLCFMLYVECKSSNKCRDYWTRRPPIMNCDCDPQRWGRISRQFGWELLQSKLRIGWMQLVEGVWCMIIDDLELLIVGVVDDETQRGLDCRSLWGLQVHLG